MARTSKSAKGRALGFTLIELMVAAGIMVIAVGAASYALINQYQGMQSADLARLANSSNRAAIQAIEHSLREAGWGIDPKFGIDLKYGCSSWPCRDRTNAPDDLVFVTRNPLYRWSDFGVNGCGSAYGCFDAGGNAWSVDNADITGHTVNVTLPSGYTLLKGQQVLLTCAQGQSAVMLRLSASYTGTGASLKLAPESTNLVPYNDFNSMVACHNQPGAALFLVDRYHYFVENLPVGCSGSACTPWLMLDTGLDLNGDNTLPVDSTTGKITDQNDLIPVAKNVEDMQVAYVLNSSAGLTAPDNNKDWVLGNGAAAEEPTFNSAAPNYDSSSTDPARYTTDSANVRAVKVSLRLRSDRKDPRRPSSWVGDAVPFAENRTGSAQQQGYRQYTAETEIYLRNLESRLAFIY